MTKSVFLCVINGVSTKTDLGKGLEIIANEKNQNYPIIKLTNNKEIIARLLNNNLEKLIGLIEFGNFTNPKSLVAFSISEFDESKINSIFHLDYKLSLLKMFFFCLWIVKDNSADFDLGFLYFVNSKKDFETSSNVFSSSNFNCNGKFQIVDFSVKELNMASRFLHDNIIIETKKSKTASSNASGRITIANYFIQHARSCSDLGIKMTSYCSALETLFSNDSTELSHKLAERTAHFLSKDKIKRIHTFKLIKKCYEIRSKVVHGATFNPEKIKEIESLIVEMDNTCRRIMKYSLTTPEKKNVFAWTKEKHEEYFLNLIMM